MTMRPPTPSARLLVALTCASLGAALRAAPDKAPYLDPALPIEARIDVTPRSTIMSSVRPVTFSIRRIVRAVPGKSRENRVCGSGPPASPAWSAR